MRAIILASVTSTGAEIARLVSPLADLQVKQVGTPEEVIAFEEAHDVAMVIIAPSAESGQTLDHVAEVKRRLTSDSVSVYAVLSRGVGPTPAAALAAGATEVCYLDASETEFRNRLRLLLDLTRLRGTLYSERDRNTQATILDPLTGLMNRPAFLSRLDAEIGRAKRSGSGMVVAMMEIDHLSAINERHGFSAGDQVLMAAAQQIQEVLRDMDIAGRIGGSEFAICLPDADMANGASVLERLRRRLVALAFPTPREPLTITVSIGVTAFLESDEDSSDALNRADRALLRAKDAGRNRLERA